MVSPTCLAAARRISPNAAAELGRRAGSIFNPSSIAEQIESGAPLRAEIGDRTRYHATNKRNRMLA